MERRPPLTPFGFDNFLQLSRQHSNVFRGILQGTIDGIVQFGVILQFGFEHEKIIVIIRFLPGRPWLEVDARYVVLHRKTPAPPDR